MFGHKTPDTRTEIRTLLNNFDPAKTDRIQAADLTPMDLGRDVMVSAADGHNTVFGKLRAINFADYRQNIKEGKVYTAFLTVGRIEVAVDKGSEVWLVKE